MKDLIDKTAQYVESVLDISLSVGEYPLEKDFPLLIQNRYQIFKSTLLNESILLIIPREYEKISPSALKKNLFQIEERTGLYPVYLCSDTSSYTRQELIKNKISFIVPDNQLYLPRLGISLREYFKRKIVTEKTFLSTIAQLVLFYHFYNPDETELSPSFMAGKLGYTIMSLSRAFKELESFQLGRLEKQGRKTVLHFISQGEELWKASLPLMLSPVKRTVSVLHEYEDSELMAASGYSALSELTMINPPPHPVYAMSLTSFNSYMKKEGWTILPDEVSDKIEIQLWRYNPVIFSDTNRVDTLSLFLSFKGESDERTESALEELLEEVKW